LTTGRCLVVAVWFYFLYDFMRSLRAFRILNPTQININNLPLSTLLYLPALEYDRRNSAEELNSFFYKKIISYLVFPIYMVLVLCSLVDLTLLHILPWKNTEVSYLLVCYPKMQLAAGCMITMSIVQGIQLSAAIDLLCAGSDAASNIDFAFAAVSAVLFPNSLLKTSYFLKFREVEKLDMLLISNKLGQELIRASSNTPSSVGEVTVPARISDLEDSGDDLVVADNESSSKMSIQLKNRSFSIQRASNTIKAEESRAARISLHDLELSVDLFTTKIQYAEQQVDVMKAQLLELNVNPLTYIPLDQLNAEIEQRKSLF
jgi:hypothetical protein